MAVNCPKCDKEYQCGCGSCAPRHKANGVVCSIPEGDYDTCGHCGHKMHVEEWLEVEYEYYKKVKGEQNG